MEMLYANMSVSQAALAPIYASISFKVWKKTFQITMLLLLLVAVATAEKCMHPDPATNFDDALYAGRWYEVCGRS